MKTDVPTKIKIQYIPTRYITVNSSIYIYFPEIMWTAIWINIYGECKPGILRYIQFIVNSNNDNNNNLTCDFKVDEFRYLFIHSFHFLQ